MAKNPFTLSPSGMTLHINTPSGTTSVRIPALAKKAARVYEKAHNLTYNIYGDSPQIPLHLGMGGEMPSFIRESVERVWDVIAGEYTDYSPQQIVEDVRNIQTVATSAKAFNAAYYGEIARYYGHPNLTVKQTKYNLKQHKFVIPLEEYKAAVGGYNPGSDPTRLQEWIIDHIPNSNKKAIHNEDNVNILRQIVEDWEVEGVIDKQYAQRYVRKRVKSYSKKA